MERIEDHFRKSRERARAALREALKNPSPELREMLAQYPTLIAGFLKDDPPRDVAPTYDGFGGTKLPLR